MNRPLPISLMGLINKAQLVDSAWIKVLFNWNCFVQFKKNVFSSSIREMFCSRKEMFCSNNTEVLFYERIIQRSALWQINIFWTNLVEFKKCWEPVNFFQFKKKCWKRNCAKVGRYQCCRDIFSAYSFSVGFNSKSNQHYHWLHCHQSWYPWLSSSS